MNERRRLILDFIQRFESEFDRLPSGREIAQGLDIRPDTLHRNLKAMERMKYVRLTLDYRGRYLITSYRLEGETIGMLDERRAVSA